MLWWFAETGLVAGLLAAFAALAGRSRRLGPEARHALWLVVLIRLVLPPVVSWPWSLPDPWATPAATAAAEGPRAGPAEGPAGPISLGSGPEDEIVASLEARRPAPPPIPAVPASRSVPSRLEIWNLRSALPRLLLAAWLAGSVAVAGSRLVRVARFRRSLAGAEAAPGWLADEARAVGDRLGVRPPPILVTPKGRTPLLWCLGRPVLIVPSALVDRLAADRWPGILAHELAHLGRRDHWVARLELLAEAAWWWNPLFWHVRRRLREEAELACDARVVRALPARRFAYAEALIEVCEHLSRSRADAIPSPALGVVGPGPSRSLEGRLTMILGEPAPHRPHRLAALAIAALAALSAPGWTLGQQPPEPPRAEAAPKPAEAAEPPRVAAPDQSPEKPAEAAPADDPGFLALESPEGAAISGLDPGALGALMAEPDVIAAARGLRRARAGLDDVIRRSRSAAEPEEQAARKRLDEASRQYMRVWSEKAGQARQRPTPGADEDVEGGLKLDPSVLRELNADPALAILKERFKRASDKADQIARATRNSGDPALRQAKFASAAILRQYQELYESKKARAVIRNDEGPLLRARRDGKLAELQKAEAQRRLARAVVARNESLLKKNPNLVGREEVEKGEAELAIAEAEVAGRAAALAEADALLKRDGPGPDGAEAGPRPVTGPTLMAVAPPGPLPPAMPIEDRAGIGTLKSRPVGAPAPAPALNLSVEGRPTAVSGETIPYKITLANVGDAPAEAILVSATLPPQGGRLANGPIPDGARFDNKDRKLTWAIPRLEAGRFLRLSFAYQVSAAGYYSCAVEATSGEARVSDRVATSVAEAPPAAVAAPRGSLTEAREAVELIEPQLQARRAELRGAEAAQQGAVAEVKRLDRTEPNNLPAPLADRQAAEVRYLTASAEVDRKRAEVREYEVRLKQARRRAEAEEAFIRADLDRARARVEWSEQMEKKGYVSKATSAADRLTFDRLMKQLDPDYKIRAPEADVPEKP